MSSLHVKLDLLNEKFVNMTIDINNVTADNGVEMDSRMAKAF